MKRLRTVLVVLFALTLSLCLFACGGGEQYKVSVEYDSNQGTVTLDPQKDKYAQDEKVVVTVTAKDGFTVESFKVNDADAALTDGKYEFTVKGDTSVKVTFAEGVTLQRITSHSGEHDLTDSATDTDLQAMLAGIKLNVRYADASTASLGVDDCTVSGLDSVKLGEVGSYTITLTPKKGNSSNVSLDIKFSIVHDWQDSSEEGVKVCKHDNARLVMREEDTVIHYGDFHKGINETIPGAGSFPEGMTPWTETSVYTNNKADNSALSKFGTVQMRSGAVEVPTVTVGQLEKGMTITVRGTAISTVDENGPWNHENKYYNSPSIGIADRDLNLVNPAHKNYIGGTSVIVREEGWVLYNGIGGTSDAQRTLASIMGGTYESTTTWVNYGSHVDATENRYPVADPSTAPDYVPGKIPTDWSKVQDWWVYSEGKAMQTTSYYGQEAKIEYSWTYREDGIIELKYVYDYDSEDATTLTAYIKVPDSANGYYDTILHGDYCDIRITESEVITKLTPAENGFTYSGLVDGAKKEYAENEAFDASTIKATMKYEQTSSPEALRIANSQVFAYTGSEDLATVRNSAEILNSTENWVSMLHSNLSANYKIFKIHFSKGGRTFVALMNDAQGGLPFTIVPNKIDSARGADVTVDGVLFENDDKVGSFDLKAEGGKIVLTLADTGYAHSLSEAQKAVLSADKYIAIHLYGATMDTLAQFDDEFTVKSGTADVPYKHVLEDGNVYLVLGVSASTKSITISGLQGEGSEIVIDLEKLVGLNASSVIGEHSWALNKGGNVTVTYQVPANTEANAISVYIGGADYFNVGEWLGTGSEADYSGQEYLVGGCRILTIKYTKATGTLELSFEAPAANIANYAPVEISLNLSGSVEIVDKIHYDFSFEKEDGAALLDDGYYVTASGSGLVVAKAYKLNDLKNGAINGSVTLNVNAGDYDQFTTYGLLTVDYEVVDGEVVIINGIAGVSGSVVLVGTYGDSRDTDYGAIVVLTVNTAKLGIESGDYYFEEVGETFNASSAPESIYKISAGKLSVYTIGGSTELVLTTEGTCLKEGLYAWAVKDGDTVICYAGAAASGGEHVDKNGDNTCDLCGGSITSNKTVKPDANWFPEGHPSINIVEGDVVTFTGTYKDSIAEGGYDSVLAVFIEEAEGAGWDSDGNDEHTNGTYHTTQDGFANWTNFNGWNSTRTPYAEDVPGFTLEDGGYERFSSSVITEEHPYNTGNGWTNAYGTILDETNFNAAKQGGTFRFIITYLNGVITTTAQLWGPDMAAFHSTPFFEYYTTIKVDPTAGRYTVKIFGKQATTNHVSLVDDEIVVTKLHTTNSAVKDVVSAAVGTHAAPENVEYAVSTSGEYTVVKLTGVAPKETAGHYVSFKVNFSQALVDTTSVKLVGKQNAVIANAVCTLAEDHKSVEVYLPISDGMKEAYLDFTNYEASTLQSDIKIDLNDLAVSDVTSAVTGTDSLTIAEGSFTVTYTGSVQNTDTLVVGEVSKALSELANETDLGNGYSVKAQISGTTTTVTVKKAAANLTKEITDVEIRLERDGSLLARDVIGAAVKVAGGAELNGKGWYATANGATLILFTNAYSDLSLNVNAGEKTEIENLANYDLSVVNGAFKASNLLTKNGSVVVSKSGETTLTVLVLDLASLGVEAATPYGYQADETKYYTVNGTREIADVTPETSGSKKTLIESDCVTAGLEAYETADKSFYYNLNALATGGHNWVKKDSASEDELHGYDAIYTCSNECGAIKYEQTATTQTWGGGTAGSYDGWGTGAAANWEMIGTVHKGGVVVLEGTNYSNEANRWNMPALGLATGNENPDGLRLDNYNFALDTYKLHPVFENAIVDGDTQKLDNTKMTFTFDYSNGKNIVITAKLENTADSFNKTVTVTLTPEEPADSYTLWMHQDANKYTASKYTQEVPKDKTPSNALTKHVHQYNPDTHRCPDDNALDPAHTTHTYDKDNNNLCGCGAVNPEHTHVYENGACKYCGFVQGENPDGFTAVEGSNGEVTGFNSRWYTSPVALGAEDGLTVGKKLVIVGSQTSAMAQNYHAVCWEVLAGYTGRADAYGWTFDPDLEAGDGVTAFGTVTNTFTLTDKGGVDASGTDVWATFKKIGASANWRVEFDYKDASTLIVSVTVSATVDGADLIYNCVYTCPIANADMITRFQTIWIGAESATNLTVKGYKLIG